MLTALIAGGSRGIGAACVRAFAASGYRVCFIYERSLDAARALEKETGAIPVRADIGDWDEAVRACEAAGKQLGHIDALVCCAGIAQQRLFTDITRRDWERMLSVNLTGAAAVARAALPEMISRKSGSVTFVSSVWGARGASMEAHYSASKAGLIGLSKALAKELGPSGIRVNAIAPGVIKTDMLSGFDDAALSALAQDTPLMRLGTPEEVAGCALFLASSAASFITGQTLGVDGGFGA